MHLIMLHIYKLLSFKLVKACCVKHQDKKNIFEFISPNSDKKK